MKDLLDSITDSRAIEFGLFFLLAVVCISVYYQLGENIIKADMSHRFLKLISLGS